MAARFMVMLLAALLGAACASRPTQPARSGLDLSTFDRSVRPQDDLFRFVNGAWLDRTPIPGDRANYGAFAQLDEAAQANLHALLEETVKTNPPPGTEERKLADFYASFMDTATVEARGLAPLAPELARIMTIATPADVAAYIGHNQGLGVSEPLAFYVQQDARDATRYIMGVYQNGLTMPDRDYYLREEPRYAEYRRELTSYATDLLRLAGQADAEAQAATVARIERQLAEAHWTRVQNRDPIATYNKWTLADATRLAPQIDWRRFFDAIGAAQPEFIVSQPGFVTALGRMIQGLPAADWQVYFRYHLLDSYAPLLGSAFEQRHFAFHQRVLSGVEEQRPRWKRAVELVDNSIGEISGRLYVQRHFHPEAKRRMQELVANLLQAYEQSIDTLPWMTPETRIEARRKLASFSVKIGYPDKWRDYSALDVRAGDLLGNQLRAAQFEHRRAVDKLGKPIDRSEWSMTPPTVNAYYSPLRNEIVFPAAILQPPFFDAQADAAVNYGGIGAVIGHEISHGFDDKGSQFDGTGNLRNWWTDGDARQFKQRTAALVSQFAAFRVLDAQPLNGELTLGENIADLSGLAIAYKAWQLSLKGREAPVIDGFTGEQRLFLGWSQVWRRKYRDDNLRQRLSTDPHSPSEFRANGPVSNIDAFHAAFGVREGDKLYRRPEERVRIW